MRLLVLLFLAALIVGLAILNAEDDSWRGIPTSSVEAGSRA